MKIETNKKALLNWIKELEDPILLATLQSVRKNTTEGDFWNDLPEETKKAINKAKIQLREGHGISNEHIKEEVRQKFNR